MKTTPTQRQIASLQSLDIDALYLRAVESMHALNRRAKKYRDNRNAYKRATFANAIKEQIEEIYNLKDAFLTAIIERELPSKISYFYRPGNVYHCAYCDNTWVCNNDGDSCECRECGDDVDPSLDTWWLIECGEYSFHSPNLCFDQEDEDIGDEIEPHNPNQPQRIIPKCGLTIAAQKACVQMMIDKIGETK